MVSKNTYKIKLHMDTKNWTEGEVYGEREVKVKIL